MGGEGKRPLEEEGPHPDAKDEDPNEGAKEEWGSIAEAIASIEEPDSDNEVVRHCLAEDLKIAKDAFEKASRGTDDAEVLRAFRVFSGYRQACDSHKEKFPLPFWSLQDVLTFIIGRLRLEGSDQHVFDEDVGLKVPRVKMRHWITGVPDLRLEVSVSGLTHVHDDGEVDGCSVDYIFVFTSAGRVTWTIGGGPDVQKKQFPQSASWREAVVHVLQILTWVYERHERILSRRRKKTAEIKLGFQRELKAAKKALADKNEP